MLNNNDHLPDKLGNRWMGFTDTGRSSKNYTSFSNPGKEITFKNFKTGFPTTYTTRNCIYMNFETGLWEDYYCYYFKPDACTISRAYVDEL